MFLSPKRSQRQEAKEKAKALKDLYFLVQWEEKDQEDGESLYDVLPSKAILCDDPLTVVDGQEISASFQKKTYPAKIVGRGTYLDMDKLLDAKSATGTAQSPTTVNDGDTSSTTGTAESLTSMNGDTSSTIENSPSKRAATKYERPKKSPPSQKSQSKPKSKPKSKARISADKARSKENDRMSSLILASIDDHTNGSPLGKSSPKSKARKRARSPSTDEDDCTPSQSKSEKSSPKTKARKKARSPVVPSTDEDYYTSSRSSTGKPSPVSKVRKRARSPSTGKDPPSQFSPGKSPKRDRESSPRLSLFSEDYTGLIPLDDSGETTLPQRSKDDASSTPISHSTFDPLQGSFGSGSSSSYSSSHFHSRETPRRWNEKGSHSQSHYPSDFSTFAYDCVSTTPSVSPSPVFNQSSMAVLTGASQSQFFPPISPPYMMPHSQSWPPSNQKLAIRNHHSKPELCMNISVQMAEMKHLLMTSLSAMQSEIQTLKADAVNKPKKRKRSREQSVAGQSDSEQSEISIKSPPQTVPGVLLGDPHSENKFIAHPSIRQRDIKAVEAVCSDGKKFVLAILDIFFNKATLARSLVTRKEGRDLLDPDIIEGIRLHTDYRYPTSNPVERWQKIQKSINDKCRNTKNRSKD